MNGEEEYFKPEEGQEEKFRATLAVEHLTLDNEESKQFMINAMKDAMKSEAIDIEDVKPMAAKKVKIALKEVKVDPELIKTVWPYMRPDEDIITADKIAANGEKIMQDLNDEIEIAITKNNSKIQQILAAFPNAESEEEKVPFEVTSICSQGLEILQDCPIDFEDWSSASADEEWVIRTLKLWFFCIKDFAVVHQWASWPQILDDTAFIKKAKDVIEEQQDDFYDYLQINTKKLLLDDPAHLAKVECLLNHLGGPSMIDPHHSDGDSSVGTFMMFIMKDALQYAGLLPEKSRRPGKEIRLCNYKKGLYEQFHAQLQTALGF